ncbi:MAG: GYD domain-containing protein [Rhodospirillaceae bacterium]|jgi:uncharacterized protein with GYD domain|nr:GYD domain-containing protein [Rhodospirillaceae bacterium]
MRVVFFGCYAPHAMKGIIAGSDREAAVKALLDSVGGTLASVMFTRGEFDVVVLADVPDEAAGIGLAMAIHASGAFTRISVLNELNMEPVLSAANKAMKIYKPAG